MKKVLLTKRFWLIIALSPIAFIIVFIVLLSINAFINPNSKINVKLADSEIIKIIEDETHIKNGKNILLNRIIKYDNYFYFVYDINCADDKIYGNMDGFAYILVNHNEELSDFFENIQFEISGLENTTANIQSKENNISLERYIVESKNFSVICSVDYNYLVGLTVYQSKRYIYVQIPQNKIINKIALTGD
ncbi:hypothetical protein FACS189499_05200 [Clostridia bacterium]|nr:hypothetical protein FACS189499_05200 [Clostridia bacterium]